MRMRDNGIQACNNEEQYEQSKTNPTIRTWDKSVTYADDATIITQLNADSIRRIIKIYEIHTKTSGLRINFSKTEVYVVTESLKQRCQEITY